MTLETVALRFSEFKRALREGDRMAFDRLMDRARSHASAASFEASLDPLEVLFLSILLDQEIEIGRLERALEEMSWAVLGRPAASGGTLDRFGVGRPPPEAALPVGVPLQVKADYMDKTGRGWNFTFKDDGRRAASAARPPAEAEGAPPGAGANGSDPL